MTVPSFADIKDFKNYIDTATGQDVSWGKAGIDKEDLTAALEKGLQLMDVYLKNRPDNCHYMLGMKLLTLSNRITEEYGDEASNLATKVQTAASKAFGAEKALVNFNEDKAEWENIFAGLSTQDPEVNKLLNWVTYGPTEKCPEKSPLEINYVTDAHIKVILHTKIAGMSYGLTSDYEGTREEIAKEVLTDVEFYRVISHYNAKCLEAYKRLKDEAKWSNEPSQGEYWIFADSFYANEKHRGDEKEALGANLSLRWVTASSMNNVDTLNGPIYFRNDTKVPLEEDDEWKKAFVRFDMTGEEPTGDLNTELIHKKAVMARNNHLKGLLKRTGSTNKDSKRIAQVEHEKTPPRAFDARLNYTKPRS